MIVKFNHPPVQGSNNPFKDFVPSNQSHYPTGPGIYIYGLKLDIDINGKPGTKFVPFYVGIAKNLQSRLWQHYMEEKTGRNSKWAVFEIDNKKTLNDFRSLFKDIMQFDLDLYKRSLDPVRLSINNLIWFNHSSFFDLKLNLNAGTSKYLSDSGQLTSICPGGDLDSIHKISPKCGADNLKYKIIQVKKLYDNSYYFVYANFEHLTFDKGDYLFKDSEDYRNNNLYIINKKNGPGRNIFERVEFATKVALKRIGIYTAAKAKGKSVAMSIDLSNIQNELINLGNHNLDSTNYNKQLIINI